MANFLESLGIGGGTDVFVAISPNNTMEMCILEKGQGGVKAYAKTSLPYNDSAREIADYSEFMTKIQELYSACGISAQNTRVHMSLPLVWFGRKDGIQLLDDDEAIKNILIGELDQTFIFKRREPVPAWFDAQNNQDATTRSVFYSAIQAEAISEIKNSLKSIGANLVSIDFSTFSYLRALYATGRISTFIEANNFSWNLMIINNNGLQMYGMQNEKLLESYEEPIILSSFEGEEVYTQIANSAQMALVGAPANALVVISETDLVSAEKLAGKLQYSGEVVTVDDNKYRKSPVADICYSLPQEEQLNVSLNLIGSFAGVGMLPWGLNFITESDDEDAIEIQLTADKVIKLTPKKALRYSLISALIAIPFLIIYGATSVIYSGINTQLQDLNSKITEVDNQLGAYEKQGNNESFNPVQETERVLKNNRLKIMSYAALGESIPKNLYLTYFMTGDDGYVDIQGCANSVEDVYIFFQNLKDSLVEAKLRLNKLDLKAGSLDTVINSNVSTVDNAPYIFEITNMSDSQLATFMKALNDGGQQPENGTQPQPQAAGDIPAPPTN